MTSILSATKHLTLLIGFVLTFNAYGDTLYCPDGKQMKCLGFSEKIVSNNAVCFDAFTCDQDGFVCKSELDAMADEHEGLLNKHNDLVNTYNELHTAYVSTVSGHEELVRCLSIASTLDEAKGCI